MTKLVLAVRRQIRKIASALELDANELRGLLDAAGYEDAVAEIREITEDTADDVVDSTQRNK
ncbi:MAG: hypothetical protein R2932_48495 [Caldilineaceae bacterium]